MTELLSARGYGLVLSALLSKYSPYLEIAGPTSIDRFLYHGERAKGETFVNYKGGGETRRGNSPSGTTM